MLQCSYQTSALQHSRTFSGNVALYLAQGRKEGKQKKQQQHAVGTFFPACFLPYTSRSRRLACLRSHVLRAYCNFDSKQAISITLFERRPSKKNVRKH